MGGIAVVWRRNTSGVLLAKGVTIIWTTNLELGKLPPASMVVTYGPRPTLEELERCGYALRSGYQGDAALEAGALHGAGEEASRSSR